MRLEWKIGNTCDPGRDRFWDVSERVEYVDRRSLAYRDARWEFARLPRASVAVGGWVVKQAAAPWAGGDGEVAVAVADMTVGMFGGSRYDGPEPDEFPGLESQPSLNRLGCSR